MIEQIKRPLLKLSRKMGFDRAVIFATLIRVWALISGPVSVLLIATIFSSELQGYYYTFNSLLALTAFLELGLATVVQLYASHEWAHLRLDKSGDIQGDETALNKLISLTRLAFKWYIGAGVLAILGLIIFGIVFFAPDSSGEIDWLLPWLALSALSGVNLVLLPAWTVLEGCNQMSRTLKAKLVLSIIVSLTTWTCIVNGGGLWTAAIVSFVNIAASILYLIVAYRRFFARLLLGRGTKIIWRTELWPVQWKIALAWISNYFMFSIFTPVVFHFEGSVKAGQMGLSWTAIYSILMISYSWVATRAPQFGIYIARKEFDALDRLFKLLLIQITIIGSLASVFLWLVIQTLNIIGHPLSTRFIEPKLLLLFILAILPCMWTAAITTYLRAHKDEPLVSIHFTAGLLTLIISIVMEANFGIQGVGIGFLAVSCFAFFVPTLIVFRRLQQVWHTRSAQNIAA